MKLSEFREELKLRINLFKANIWFTFQTEIAYAGNNWAGIASTTFYTLSILVFINILFAKIQTLAGYGRQDMLLFFLLGQIIYYTNWTFSMRNVYDLIVDVNRGNLDMVLTKPVPALFYLSTRSMNILNILKEGTPPTLAIVLSIKWSSMAFSFENVLICFAVLILSLWITHAFTLIASLPVFWLGESTDIVDLSLQIASGNGVMIPLEGYSKKLLYFFGLTIPAMLSTAAATSALLGKSNPRLILILTIMVAIFMTILRAKLWKFAIKNYTSASS